MIDGYKDQMISVFKNKFKNCLHQGREILFQNLINECVYEVGLPFDEIYQELKTWFDNIYHQAWLTPFLKILNWEEIIVHSEIQIQIFKKNERQFQTISLPPEDYQLSLEILAYKNQQKWHLNDPFVSFHTSVSQFRLRMTLVHSSLSGQGPSKLSIRRHQHSQIEISSFFQQKRIEELVIDLVKAKKNILIAGSTGSGKTSFLNSLLSQIEQDEHVIVMEDTPEIESSNFQWTHWMSQQKEGYTLKDFCSFALRMRPDRMVIGELRSHEIVPFILSMNTGHSGLMSTIHANSALETFARLKTLFALYADQKNIREDLLNELIVKGLNFIIFIKDKKVVEVIQIYGAESGKLIYEQIFDANH